MKCEIITGNMPQLWEELLLQLQEQKYPSILLSFVFATSFSSPPLFYEHNQYHNDSEKSIRKT